MPKGGYCEVDGRWVWVTPDGYCENGHPPDRMREVQQLVPLTHRGTPIPTPSRPTVVPYRLRFWWRHSGWLVLTLTWGFLNWLAFVYIGLRARQRLWLVWGFVYLVPLALFIASIGSGYAWYALAFQVFVAVVSVVHGIILRPRYRAIMFGDAPLGSVPQPPRVVTRGPRPTLERGLEDNAAQMLREAADKVARLGETANVIAKPEVRQAVGRLSVTADEILQELSKHPERIELARSFLTYYLDVALRVTGGYQELSSRMNPTPEMSETVARAESSLPGIQHAFDSQLGSLLQVDLLDLDSEIALLDKMTQINERFEEARGLPPSASRGSGDRQRQEA
jgi:hypothetical protein